MGKINNSRYAKHYSQLPRPSGRGLINKKYRALATLLDRMGLKPRHILLMSG